MKRMANREVIREFLQGNKDVRSHNGNLYVTEVDGKTVLVNYVTPLAIRFSSGALLLNEDHYSCTTSKLQTWLANDSKIVEETHSVLRVNEDCMYDAINHAKFKLLGKPVYYY